MYSQIVINKYGCEQTVDFEQFVNNFNHEILSKKDYIDIRIDDFSKCHYLKELFDFLNMSAISYDIAYTIMTRDLNLDVISELCPENMQVVLEFISNDEKANMDYFLSTRDKNSLVLRYCFSETNFEDYFAFLKRYDLKIIELYNDCSRNKKVTNEELEKVLEYGAQNHLIFKINCLPITFCNLSYKVLCLLAMVTGSNLNFLRIPYFHSDIINNKLCTCQLECFDINYGVPLDNNIKSIKILNIDKQKKENVKCIECSANSYCFKCVCLKHFGG